MNTINPKKPGIKPPVFLRFIANIKRAGPKCFDAALATKKFKFLTTILHKFVLIFTSDWSIGSREARINSVIFRKTLS
jgi:hypothetical protein